VLDRLTDIGCWLVDNFAIIADLFFAAAVAFAAVVGVRLNRRLVEETSQLRRAETDPFVAVFIEYQRLRPSFLDMVIRNAGRGPAYDITFSVDPDVPVWVVEQEEDDGGQERREEGPRLTDLAVFQNGIKAMVPSQEVRFFFGSASQLTTEAISIRATYFGTPIGGQRPVFSETFLIDASIFDGMSTVGTPPEMEVANSLKRIQKDIERIRKGGSWSNMGVTVRRSYFFSRAINQRWFHLSGWWRNERIRWQNGQHPWQHRWDQMRRLIRK